jgi:hypothetical protein
MQQQQAPPPPPPPPQAAAPSQQQPSRAPSSSAAVAAAVSSAASTAATAKAAKEAKEARAAKRLSGASKSFPAAESKDADRPGDKVEKAKREKILDAEMESFEGENIARLTSENDILAVAGMGSNEEAETSLLGMKRFKLEQTDEPEWDEANLLSRAVLDAIRHSLGPARAVGDKELEYVSHAGQELAASLLEDVLRVATLRARGGAVRITAEDVRFILKTQGLV